MAVARDTEANFNGASGSFTVANVANRVMTIYIHNVDGTDTVTGATYNGVAATLIDKIALGSGKFCYAFGLIGPATGTHTVAITGSANNNFTVHSYNGAIYSTHGVAGPTTGTAITRALTTAVDGSIVSCAMMVDSGTATIGTFTNVANVATTGAGSATIYSGSSTNISPVASTTQSGTASTSTSWVEFQVEISAVNLPITVSETQASTDTDVFGFSTTISETQAETDSTKLGFLPQDLSKNISSWTNQQKS